MKFLKLQKLEVRNTREKSENEKNLMKMRCCIKPYGQTDVGSSQKTFPAFSFTSKCRLDPNSKFFTEKFFFSFLALFREKFRLPLKTFLA